MKHDCDVVRDLMPLVVDGTASDKSRNLVEEHAGECEPCRVMLEEMRQEVPAEPPTRQADRLVRKLRRRRRLRSAVLVLLGVAASVIVLAASFQGWQYYFNTYEVPTAQEDYGIELVPKDIYGVQMILTNRNGHEQLPVAVFDYDTGDLYVYSQTTHLPWPARHETQVIQLSEVFYFEDIGYAERTRMWDEEACVWYTDMQPINHVYKGAMPGSQTEDSPTLLYELEHPADEALTQVWRERMTAWGVELNPPPQTE